MLSLIIREIQGKRGFKQLTPSKLVKMEDKHTDILRNKVYFNLEFARKVTTISSTFKSVISEFAEHLPRKSEKDKSLYSRTVKVALC